jgi:hypothetical protein
MLAALLKLNECGGPDGFGDQKTHEKYHSSHSKSPLSPDMVSR